MNDSREDDGEPIDSVEDTILAKVESPLAGMPGTLSHPEPRIGPEWIPEEVEQLLLEELPVRARKGEELLFGGLEKLVVVGGQASPARFMTSRPGMRFSVCQRRSISRKNSSS